MKPEKLLNFYSQSRHTHPELTDPELRRIFANELLLIRRACKIAGDSPNAPYVKGIRMGIETALRRVQAVNESNIETVFKINYK